MTSTSKKGQLIGQPLVYAFAMIAGALILAWGVNTVLKLQNTAGQVELAKFANKLESETDKYLNFDEGSSTTIKASLPSKITHICFYDTSATRDCKLNGKTCNVPELDEKFAALINANTKHNVFFLPLGTYNLPPKQIKNLKAEGGNPLCFKSGTNIILTSKGTYVSAS